jgi:hypothetical protein
MAPSRKRAARRTKAPASPVARYAGSVFINCPFDPAYAPLFDAAIFAVAACGFTPRSAFEIDDASRARFDKIAGLIAECRLGIHDISRTEPDSTSGLPRFNMPLELGLFLGAHRYGSGPQRRKLCLVLDTERYRYQRFISDIAGQDIKAHGNDPIQVIAAIRGFLAAASGSVLPGGRTLLLRFTEFRAQLPGICHRFGLEPDELTFPDYCLIVTDWLAARPAP